MANSPNGPQLQLVFPKDPFWDLSFSLFTSTTTEVVSSDIRIFADNTFIYRTADSDSTLDLNNDVAEITNWAWQWKMLFNPSISKQAVEVLFSNKKNKSIFPPLNFNGIPVKQVDETQHLGMILDSNLSFNNHLENKIAKANQGLGVMIQLKNGYLFEFLKLLISFMSVPILTMVMFFTIQQNPTKMKLLNSLPRLLL